MQNIEKELKDYLLTCTAAIQEVLFIPNVVHPVWNDSAEILQLANQQILQPVGAIPDEHILAFIGVHAKTIITGKRDSLGFLITNFRILTQTDFSVILTAKNARTDFFTKRQLPQAVSSKVWSDFITNNQLSIDEEPLLALNDALKSVIGIVLSGLQQLNHLPVEIKKSSNIYDRIKDLGLQEELKSYAADEKRFKQFAAKHNVPDIICGLVDKSFFGGVYGLVISKNGITSRDLMEDSVSSDWQEIKDNPPFKGDKKDVILVGEKKHIVPVFKSEVIPSLITLINEISNNEIFI